MRLAHSVGSNRGEGGYVRLLVLSNLQGCWFALVGKKKQKRKNKKKTPVGTDLHISRIVRHVGFSLNISLLNCNVTTINSTFHSPTWRLCCWDSSLFIVYIYVRITLSCSHRELIPIITCTRHKQIHRATVSIGLQSHPSGLKCAVITHSTAIY